MKKSRQKTLDLFATIGVILLSLYTLSLFFPFLWAFFASLKDSFDFSKNPFWPTKDMSFDNFVNAFRYMSVEVSGTQGTKTVLFVRLVLNSLVGAFIMWLINAFSSITGFGVTINPLSVLLTGAIGIPGVALVVGLTTLFA